MKFAALILTMFLAAVSAAGQVLTLKNDIPEIQYLAAEAKAAELLKTANYRSVWTKEYLEDRSKAATLQEKSLREVLQPDKWRTVEEKFYDKPQREENVWVGRALYVKRNDEHWEKYDGSASSSHQHEGGPTKDQFRYLPSVDFDGKTAEFYEKVSVRTANKYSRTDVAVVKAVRTTRIWYSADGKILKKTDERTAEGYEEMLREVTTYEYDPKDLKIEAPAIK